MRVIEMDRLPAFWQALLCGFGQLLFMPSALAGALALLGIALNSLTAAALGLLGGVVSTACGFVVAPRAAVMQGLFGFNGILLGLAVALFMVQQPLLWGLVVLGAALSSCVFAMGLKHGWPLLTLPYISMTLLIYHYLPVLAQPDGGYGWHMTNWPLLSATGAGIGQMGFQGSMVTALCMMLALALAGGIHALCWALLGSVVSLLAALAADITALQLVTGVYGYNTVLTAVALGAVPGHGYRDGLTWCGIIAATLLSLLAMAWLPFPMLTAPFVLSMWLVMAIRWCRMRHQLRQQADPG